MSDETARFIGTQRGPFRVTSGGRIRDRDEKSPSRNQVRNHLFQVSLPNHRDSIGRQCVVLLARWVRVLLSVPRNPVFG